MEMPLRATRGGFPVHVKNVAQYMLRILNRCITYIFYYIVYIKHHLHNCVHYSNTVTCTSDL